MRTTPDAFHTEPAQTRTERKEQLGEAIRKVQSELAKESDPEKKKKLRKTLDDLRREWRTVQPHRKTD